MKLTSEIRIFHKKSLALMGHHTPGTYTLNHTCYEVYKDNIKFKTQSRQKTQKTQEDKTVVFQKNI